MWQAYAPKLALLCGVDDGKEMLMLRSRSGGTGLSRLVVFVSLFKGDTDQGMSPVARLADRMVGWLV